MKVQWYHVTIFTLVVVLLIALAMLAGSLSVNRDTLYQASAMDMLANGSYDGFITAGDLTRHGDFGIGTFESLNGEMVVLDGTVYQVTSDGAVHAVSDQAMIPFAEVTYFDNDSTVSIGRADDLSTLTAALEDKLPSKSVFYAIRIHDTFPYVKARSVPAQNKPYPPLSEVVKSQSVFELHNVTGTLVGIYSPGYTNGVGSPGFHFHFIADDHKSGGHVLDLSAGRLDAGLDETPGLYMSLPLK